MRANLFCTGRRKSIRPSSSLKRTLSVNLLQTQRDPRVPEHIIIIPTYHFNRIPHARTRFWEATPLALKNLVEIMFYFLLTFYLPCVRVFQCSTRTPRTRRGIRRACTPLATRTINYYNISYVNPLRPRVHYPRRSEARALYYALVHQLIHSNFFVAKRYRSGP